MSQSFSTSSQPPRSNKEFRTSKPCKWKVETKVSRIMIGKYLPLQCKIQNWVFTLVTLTNIHSRLSAISYVHNRAHRLQWYQCSNNGIVRLYRCSQPKASHAVRIHLRMLLAQEHALVAISTHKNGREPTTGRRSMRTFTATMTTDLPTRRASM